MVSLRLRKAVSPEYDYAENRYDGSDLTQPRLADLVYHDGRSLARVGCGVEAIGSSEVGYGGCSPYHGHYAFGYHRSVEYGPAVFLVSDTAGHDGTLGGVEA